MEFLLALSDTGMEVRFQGDLSLRFPGKDMWLKKMDAEKQVASNTAEILCGIKKIKRNFEALVE